MTPEQRETGDSAMAEGFRPVTAHKTGLLSKECKNNKKKKKKTDIEMAVVRTHLEGRGAKDSNSSELLTDPEHRSHWVEGVSRENGWPQGGAFVTTGGDRTWHS